MICKACRVQKHENCEDRDREPDKYAKWGGSYCDCQHVILLTKGEHVTSREDCLVAQ